MIERPTRPTERFSSRVDNYVRFRPGYPEAVVEVVRGRCGLAAGGTVVDVGSGTGLLAVRFLDAGHPVVGVEPNREMREAGERFLAGHERFTSVDGRAEATGLAPGCADLVAAGQAFHWFEVAAAGAEFCRVLTPAGRAALLWNARLTEDTPFLRDYEALLLEHSTDYPVVNHQRWDESGLRPFFTGDTFAQDVLPNRQDFDYPGLEGRLLSSSYAPPPGHPGHDAMIADLRRVFDRHETGGQVAFLYETVIYTGRPMVGAGA